MKSINEFLDGGGKPIKFETIEEFQKVHEWDGLIPGDLVRFDGEEFLYSGFASGPPGCPGMIPRFFPKIIKDYTQLYVSDQIPAEGKGFGGKMVHAQREQFEKVGHMTPEEWAAHVAQYFN